MGRKKRDEETEQLTAQIPVGGLARANALADKLSGGNRSDMVWQLLEAAEAAAEGGADLVTILMGMRRGISTDASIKKQARAGRAVVAALKKSGYEVVESGY
jgi:hypothetical protein